MRCDDVADLLPEAMDGTPLTARARRHVESCLRCQVEVARYRRLRRGLRSLRTELLDPSPGLVADVLAGVAAAGPTADGRPPRPHHAARWVGVGAVTAAGALAIALRAVTDRRVLAG